MNNELQHYASGQVAIPRHDRAVAARAKRIYDEARLSALMADGAMALAGHIMDGPAGLDAHRQAISSGDPVTDVLLTEIEVNAVRKIKQVQNRLYSDWGM